MWQTLWITLHLDKTFYFTAHIHTQTLCCFLTWLRRFLDWIILKGSWARWSLKPLSIDLSGVLPPQSLSVRASHKRMYFPSRFPSDHEENKSFCCSQSMISFDVYWWWLDEGKYEQHVTTFPNKQESLLKLKVPHCCPQPSGSFSPYREPEMGCFNVT